MKLLVVGSRSIEEFDISQWELGFLVLQMKAIHDIIQLIT